MGSVIQLLDCAISNISDTIIMNLQRDIAIAQIKQYKELRKAGAKDEDDVDEALEKYPQCELKI